MTTKKIILTAFVITIVETIIYSVTCGWLFNWIYSVEPTAAWLYKTGDVIPGNVMFLSFIGAFILNIILVWVFTVLYNSIPYHGWKKGAKYGFLVWTVSILPGMFATFMWMNVPTIWIMYGVVLGLIVLLVKGIIIGAICRKSK